MSQIVFTDKEVASRFDCLSETDVNVQTVANVNGTKAPQYNGKLSNITRAVAASMVRRGSNLLALKSGATLEDTLVAAATPSAPAATDAPVAKPVK